MILSASITTATESNSPNPPDLAGLAFCLIIVAAIVICIRWAASQAGSSEATCRCGGQGFTQYWVVASRGGGRVAIDYCVCPRGQELKRFYAAN